MSNLSIFGLSNFPIEGQLREPILILEGIIFLLSLEYGIYFFYKFAREEREKNYMIPAWGIFFLTFSLNILFFILSDFFSPLPYVRSIYINFGYIVLAFGALFFSYNAEREIKQKNHKFSIILIILIVFLIADIFVLVVSLSIFALLCNFSFMVILFVYIFKFTAKIKERWRINIYGFIFGFFLWVIGYGEMTDMAVNSFGYFIRLIGDCSIITGISLISLLFVGLPSLNEFEWPKKLRTLFIMYKNGEYIADYNFLENMKEKDEKSDVQQLIAGGLTGIDQIITEIVQSKKRLKIIDHREFKIIFQYGNYLMAAVIVDDVLNIYKTKLRKLINYLETLYESLLPNWDGNVSQFEIVKPIIKRFFSY